MRIVVIEPDGSGGMLHYAHMLCEALAGAGADVVLLTASDYELPHLPRAFAVDPSLQLWPRTGPATESLQTIPGWVRGPALITRRVWRGLKLFSAWWRITSRLLRDPPDVVQIRVLVVPANALIRRRLHRSGTVVGQVVHELGLRDQANFPGLLARFRQADFASIDAVFFHNDALRSQGVAVHAVDPKRAHLIPHGDGSIFELLDERRDAELSERYALSVDDRAILMFGGIRTSKGSDDLVRAFARLPAAPHVKLVIAGPLGKGLDVDALAGLADDLGVGDRVIFDIRYVDMGEVAALMRRAHVVVFPYRSATQSGVLATALTFGRPVVVTAVGGLPDVVEDGRNGFVVPPADPESLAVALSRILDDPDLAESMAEASLEISSRLSWAVVAERVLDVYTKLADQ